MPSFEPADATFDPRTPVPTAAELPLPRVRQAGRRFAPWSWQDDPCDATLLGGSFLRRGRQFAGAGDQLWRPPKLRAMDIQAWDKLSRSVGIALEDTRLRDDATLGLPQPQH